MIESPTRSNAEYFDSAKWQELDAVDFSDYEFKRNAEQTDDRLSTPVGFQARWAE